ncbi:MAG: carboxylesterase/lipase family protein [Clostridia bacterium]|nr:carboxylesterase/lipase family protein [Clostridia bacterium]
MLIRKLTSQVICNHAEPLAETALGVYRGVKAEGTYIFRGIRYAHAERFCAPEPEQTFEEVRNAIWYGCVCPEITTPVPHDAYTVPHVFYPQHEDCQYLNIWTQSLDRNAKRPVMVWLHGGGYSSGSGIEHYAYDGEELSKFGNCVVVTLNHRLNLLGFLDLSEAGEKYAASGNAGMLDIVEALKWVKNQIASFGGDPENVTVFGQSGGGGKVLTLLQMPCADGLYHRAVVQSGVFDPGKTSEIRRLQRRNTELMLSALGIEAGNVSALSSLPWHALASAALQAGRRIAEEEGKRFSWGPCPDGVIYRGYPFEVGFRKETATIPMMVGSVFAEFTSNCDQVIGDGWKNSWDPETVTAYLTERFGPETKRVREAFEKAYPGRNPADVLYADSRVRAQSVRLAKQRAAEGGKDTFLYLFDLESPYMDGTLAWHNAEIPYVFHNAEYLEPSFIPGVTEKLQDMICGAWVSFAEKGDPNHPEHPRWDRVTADCGRTMVYGRESSLQVQHDDELMDLISRFQPMPPWMKKTVPTRAPEGPKA